MAPLLAQLEVVVVVELEA
jgi:hypothetical protein